MTNRLNGRESELRSLEGFLEARLAALAGEGLSNKEIASALHLSVHTVEGHLTRIYRKLGVRSRAALGARLSSDQVDRVGLVPDHRR